MFMCWFKCKRKTIVVSENYTWKRGLASTLIDARRIEHCITVLVNRCSALATDDGMRIVKMRKYAKKEVQI